MSEDAAKKVSNINPANAITAARFLTLPPYLYLLDSGQYQWAAVMIIICGLADLVDGAVARLFKCTTSFGELFDAIADGVCYGFFLVCVVFYGLVPFEPIAIIIGAGVINTVMRAIYVKRAGRATNYQSFAMERTVGFVSFISGFGTVGYQVDYFCWAAAAIMVVVLIHDTKRMLIDPVPA